MKTRLFKVEKLFSSDPAREVVNYFCRYSPAGYGLVWIMCLVRFGAWMAAYNLELHHKVKKTVLRTDPETTFLRVTYKLVLWVTAKNALLHCSAFLEECNERLRLPS